MFRHDALAAELAGMMEHDRYLNVEVLVEGDAGMRSMQQFLERSFAILDRSLALTRDRSGEKATQKFESPTRVAIIGRAWAAGELYWVHVPVFAGAPVGLPRLFGSFRSL